MINIIKRNHAGASGAQGKEGRDYQHNKYRVDYKKIFILFMYLAILKEMIFKKNLF